MAQLFTGANQLVNNLQGIKEKQVWLAGTLSPRARKEIESRGWQIRDRAEAQLFNWVETYPDYKKPDERVPSGLVTLNLKSVALGVKEAGVKPRDLELRSQLFKRIEDLYAGPAKVFVVAGDDG